MNQKPLDSMEVAKRIAEKSGLTVDQVKAVLIAQAELAYTSCAQPFPIPGIGRLSKMERAERRGVIPLGPNKGQEIVIRAKSVLKFRVSRLAKDMVFGNNQGMPDIFKPVIIPELTFSTTATELSDHSMFSAGLNFPFVRTSQGDAVDTIFYRLPDLNLPSGRIVAQDPMIGSESPFARSVPPGRYPFALAVADKRVALAILRFSGEPIARWEIAHLQGHEDSPLKNRRDGAYGVDSGNGSLGDAAWLPLLADMNDEDVDFFDWVLREKRTSQRSTKDWVHIDTTCGSLAVFSSGYGDGSYVSYFGLDQSGSPAALVTDFNIVNWGPVNRGK